MKRSAKVITIVFTSFLALFLFYQILIGNPFFDPVSPVVVILCTFLMGVLGVVILIKEGAKRKKAGK